MKKLYRSQSDQKIAGICGGLGEIYGLDSNLIRIAFVFLALITHVLPLVITYFIAWLILTEGPTEE
jgi:phage shock protein PspC (stress-responsive transcriptional regulator)